MWMCVCVCVCVCRVCVRAWRVDVGWLMLGLWSWGRKGKAIDQVATARGANALVHGGLMRWCHASSGPV